MKKCIPRTSDRIITVLVAAVCAIVAVLAFCELLYGNHPPVVFFAMTFLFGGVAIHTIWRMIYMDNWGFFYDDEKIIFALSRKERREFRWEEIGVLWFSLNWLKWEWALFLCGLGKSVGWK